MLNYANIAWASTNKTKLKKLNNHQKHALRFMFNKIKLDSVSYLFNEIKTLNILRWIYLKHWYSEQKQVKSYNFCTKIPKYCTSVSYTFFKT